MKALVYLAGPGIKTLEDRPKPGLRLDPRRRHHRAHPPRNDHLPATDLHILKGDVTTCAKPHPRP